MICKVRNKNGNKILRQLNHNVRKLFSGTCFAFLALLELKDDKGNKAMSTHYNAAMETLAILNSMDLVAVPLEPSEIMLKAGVRAGKVDEKTVMKIYNAMLQMAAQDEPTSIS